MDRDIPLRNGDPVLKAVLQSLFVSEMTYPSESLFLVYPWISDVDVIDNSSGQFATLAPQFSYSRISLSQVLIELAKRGTAVLIASRPAKSSHRFFEAMEEASSRLPEGRIIVRYAEELHEKGMLSPYFYLSGSFNFTENGIEILEETAHLTLNGARIGPKLIDFDRRWISGWEA